MEKINWFESPTCPPTYRAGSVQDFVSELPNTIESRHHAPDIFSYWLNEINPSHLYAPILDGYNGWKFTRITLIRLTHNPQKNEQDQKFLGGMIISKADEIKTEDSTGTVSTLPLDRTLGNVTHLYYPWLTVFEQLNPYMLDLNRAYRPNGTIRADFTWFLWERWQYYRETSWTLPCVVMSQHHLDIWEKRLIPRYWLLDIIERDQSGQRRRIPQREKLIGKFLPELNTSSI